MIWFTSDEHYGHRNIIRFCNRPVSNLEEMQQMLIDRHNSLVGPEDNVYHLGDMFWRTVRYKDAVDIIERLNGFHIYVRGNHEEMFDERPEIADYFVAVHERMHLNLPGGPKAGIVLDHFAGRVWHGSDKGSWQLYGHSHGELPEQDNLLSLDVGVDANKLYPVSLDQVRDRMAEKVKWMSKKILGQPALTVS